MNYLITSYYADGTEILGSDSSAILRDCTMVKVNNRLKTMQPAFAFHKAASVKVFTYSQLYVHDTFKEVKSIKL